MDEFELIHHYFMRAQQESSVLTGIGDDGAIMRPESGFDLITVIDTLVEGVHFPQSMSPDDVGFRAVAVNLSDIAAMAGRPRWMTLALTLKKFDADWLQGFSNGLFAAASEHGVALVGGDTTSGRQTVVSIQMNGDVEPAAALLRSGAAPGDAIYVSGEPGEAAAGLHLMQSGSVLSGAGASLATRFRRPTARISLGRDLGPLASAAIDVSDGLFADCCKLLQASNVGGTIDLGVLPLSELLIAEFGLPRARSFALGGGDDYEMCFTAAVVDDSVLDELADKHKVRISRIGEVVKRPGLTCTEDGAVVDYSSAGYVHFGETEQ